MLIFYCFWEIHILMRLTLPPTILRISLPTLPLWSLNIKKITCQVCYPYLLICVVIQWSKNNLSGVIPLNRTDSPSPSSSGAFCPLFVCLCLWHYCVWCHKCCEFIWVTALLGLGKKWCLVVNSLWFTKFTPSTEMISHLREKRVWYRCHISAIFFFHHDHCGSPNQWRIWT